MLFSFSKEDKMHIHHVEAQQQNNSADCGLFLIAFTSCLAYYNDTEKLAFKPELITTQILKCFKNKYLTQFSSTTKRIKKCRSMTSGVKLYCICRLPYDAKWDTTQCDYCKLRTQKNQKLEKSCYEKLVLFTFCKQ